MGIPSPEIMGLLLVHVITESLLTTKVVMAANKFDYDFEVKLIKEYTTHKNN